MLNIFKYVMAVLALAGASAPLCASNPDVNRDAWKIHTTFEVRPGRIIDTPDYTFFQNDQNIYNAAAFSGYYTYHTYGLTYFDKKNPDKGIQDIHRLYELNGNDVRIVGYHPVYKYLVIAYEDGGIDIVDANGKVTFVDALKKSAAFPGAVNSLNITFDRTSPDAWVSTEVGFLRINGNNYTVKDNAHMGKTVNSICKVGEQFIAIIDGRLYEAPSDKNPGVFGSYSQMGIISETNLMSLMPLDDKSFAFMGNNGTVGHVAVKKDGEWQDYVVMTDAGIPNNVANQPEYTPLYVSINPSKDGYFVHSNTKGYLIPSNASEMATPAVKTISLPVNTKFLSSWDFKDVWYFDTRGSFAMSTAQDDSETPKWVKTVPMTRPSIPMSSKDVLFAYSPTQGMLASNRGLSYHFFYTGFMCPIQLVAMKDGEWRNLAGFYNPPVDANSTEMSLYNSNKTVRWPIGDTHGLFADPLYPEYVYGGSVYDGGAIMNAKDPTQMPWFFVYPGHMYAQNRTSATPFKNYNNASNVYAAGADGDGNVWFNQDHFSNWSGDGKISFFYLTPEDRREAMTTGDFSKLAKWKEVTATIPEGVSMPGVGSPALALKHPKNKNKLVVIGSVSSILHVYDHKGTLEDTSDDEVTNVRKVALKGLSTNTLNALHWVFENPVTGDVIVSTFADTYILDLSKPIVNGMIEGEIFGQKVGETTSPLVSGQTLIAGCADEYGRIWVGGEFSGVIGLSADRSEVYRYNTQNSPLPSDDVNALGWNPDTKSLFIATDRGIAEVKPDYNEVLNPLDQEAMLVEPTTVTPEFGGVVGVHNVSATSRVVVKNINGEIVAELPSSTDNSTYWNLCGKDGKRVAAGRYTIVDVNGNPNGVIVQVIK